MHATAICVCLFSAVGDAPRPPVEAPTPVLVEARTLDHRLIGFYTGRDAIYGCVISANAGNVGVLRRLMKERHDLKTPYSGGWTLLHFAAFQGTPQAVTLLIEHGADVNARISDGPSVLDVARNGHGSDLRTRHEIVQILQRHSAK